MATHKSSKHKRKKTKKSSDERLQDRSEDQSEDESESKSETKRKSKSRRKDVEIGDEDDDVGDVSDPFQYGGMKESQYEELKDYLLKGTVPGHLKTSSLQSSFKRTAVKFKLKKGCFRYIGVEGSKMYPSKGREVLKEGEVEGKMAEEHAESNHAGATNTYSRYLQPIRTPLPCYAIYYPDSATGLYKRPHFFRQLSAYGKKAYHTEDGLT